MRKLIKFLLTILYIFPVKRNRISFICYAAKQYSCNPKAIADYLSNYYNARFELVWFYDKNINKNIINNKNLKLCKYKTFKSIFMLMTSKYIITNVTVPNVIPYRKSQIKINTWHGAAFKNSHSNGGRGSDKTNFNIYNYFIAENELTSHVLRDSKGFNFGNIILETGMPRNDIIITISEHEKTRIKEALCKSLGIEYENKILLYAPTFRDKGEEDFCGIDFNKVKKSLENKFGGNWIVLVRYHHFTKNTFVKKDFLDVSDYPNMQDLLIVSDVLITDYSSCMWDFSLSPKVKPCFIYASDIQRYVNLDRGQFYYQINKLPFPLSENISELIKNIIDFDCVEYENKVKEYHKKSGRYNFIGNATQKVVDIIANN